MKRLLLIVSAGCLCACSNKLTSVKTEQEKIWKCDLESSGHDPFSGENNHSREQLKLLQLLPLQKHELGTLETIIKNVHKYENMQAPFIGFRAHYLLIDKQGTQWLIGRISWKYSYDICQIKLKALVDGKYEFASKSDIRHFDSKELSEFLDKFGK